MLTDRIKLSASRGERMYVIYHSSDAFSGVTGVSMTSLFENNKDMDDIHVLYIERGISDENKKKLYAAAEKYHRTLEFMEMPDWASKFNIHLKSCKSGWLGFGFNRLFLTEFIPPEIDRVLYLDSDTIIENSLSELWNTDLEGYYLAGVDDCLSSHYRDIVEIDENGTYCNSGVLLINLKKWREENITVRFLRVLEDNNGYFVFNEQSILNSVFSGKIKILPQNYNVNSLVYLFSYKELMKLRKPYRYSYNPEDLADAKSHPILTHFTGNFYVGKRPWIEGSDHPHKDAYLYYKNLSLWKDDPLNNDTRKTGSKIYTGFCHILPRGMMITLVSVLYNNIRPKSFRRKLKKERKQ